MPNPGFQRQYLGFVPYGLGHLWQQNRWICVQQNPDQAYIGGFVFPVTATVGQRTPFMDQLQLQQGPWSHIPCYPVARGGQILYHHPWQLVIYPVIHLKTHQITVKQLCLSILQASWETLTVTFNQTFFIQSKPSWGIYDAQGRKWGFLGLWIRKGVSQYGCALNLGWFHGQIHWFPKICGSTGVTRPIQNASQGLLPTFPDVFHRWCQTWEQLLKQPELVLNVKTQFSEDHPPDGSHFHPLQ